MTQFSENWKDIPGYEGRYQVSDQGRVKALAHETTYKRSWGAVTRTFNETVLAQCIGNDGRVSVSLRRNKKRVWLRISRLVAMAFIPNPENKPEVNHIDGNTLNNALSNLEWVTSSENHQHRVYVLGKGLGETNGRAKLSREDVRAIYLDPRSQSVVAKEFDVDQSAVSLIRSRLRWATELDDLPSPEEMRAIRRAS